MKWTQLSTHRLENITSLMDQRLSFVMAVPVINLGSLISLWRDVTIRSELFLVNTATQMKEKYDNNVKLERVNAATMELIMGYIYTARLEITKENAFVLLSACDYLQMSGMSECFFLSCIIVKRTLSC